MAPFAQERTVALKPRPFSYAQRLSHRAQAGPLVGPPSPPPTSRRALHRGRKLSRRHSRCGCRVPPPQDACAAGEGRLHPQQRSSGFYGNFSGYSVLTRDGRHIFAIFSHCSALRRFLRGIPCRGTAGLTGPRPFPTIAERSRRAQRSRVCLARGCSCRRGVDRNGCRDDA